MNVADSLTPEQRVGLGIADAPPVRIIPVAEYDPRDYLVDTTPRRADR